MQTSPGLPGALHYALLLRIRKQRYWLRSLVSANRPPPHVTFVDLFGVQHERGEGKGELQLVENLGRLFDAIAHASVRTVSLW